ncbi:MAG: OpgC domain-containing protein [Henriciella sp.]|nr:OpgC domain-containing protein [Henriciella sp.]
MSTRIVGIDLARSSAILLVTWKHSMASFGARGQLEGVANIGLELLMQLATPIFLILFGAMLELVYLPRYEADKAAETAKRLYRRAWQCYGYYALAIIVFFLVMGTYSLKALPLVFTGFISVPYSHLLAFYTVALALSPWLLALRSRVGLFPVVSVALAIHFAHPLISQLPQAPLLFGRDYLQHMSGFLYGQGVDFMGPSLIHGLSLVVIGMLFGAGFRPSSHRSAAKALSPTMSLWIAGGASLVIAFCWNWSSPHSTLDDLLEASLRIESHPLYFSVGVLGALGMTWFFVLTHDLRGMRFGYPIRVFGRRSLFAFGIGNILCYIAPSSLTEVLGLWGSVLALFLTVCLLTLIYDKYADYRPEGGYASMFRRVMKRIVTAE